MMFNKHKTFKLLLPVAILSAVAGVIASCNKELESRKPVSDDPTVPALVTGISVTNQPGKVTLTYTVPKDPNLLYVKAVYKMTNGREAEAKASYYSNSLELNGFADTLEHEVSVYSVSRSEVMSTPIKVKVKPQEAPIWKVYRSMKVQNAFGGFNLTALNETKSDISIMVLAKNALNEYEVDNNKSVYTNTDSILSKVRGLDTAGYRFGFLVKDRWGNTTDTLYQNVKPLFERQIDPARFAAFVLPGDAPQVTNGAALQYAWDGRLGWPYTSFTNQVPGGPGPHIITFDMGAAAKLSRLWIRPYPEGTRYYYLTTMKRFEVYGANNPNLNGALDNTWTLLGSYAVKKPSGLAYGTDSAEDQTTAAAGFDFEIDLAAPKVRYIRIRCLENFAGGTAQSINELKLYGDPR